jgi:hypothetical protein
MSLVVLGAASDRSLVAAAEVLASLGLTVDDATIERVSDLIAMECRVVAGGVQPPTLRLETLIETIRIGASRCEIILSRRFVTEVTSLLVDGSALSSSDYEVDAVSGILRRVGSSGAATRWEPGKLEVTYKAGFEVVPQPLKLAAIRAIQENLSAFARDPRLKSEIVDDVGRFDYWIDAGAGAAAATTLSPAVAAMIAPYRSLYV